MIGKVDAGTTPRQRGSFMGSSRVSCSLIRIGLCEQTATRQSCIALNICHMTCHNTSFSNNSFYDKKGVAIDNIWKRWKGYPNSCNI